jgi:hypothetical protein
MKVAFWKLTKYGHGLLTYCSECEEKTPTGVPCWSAELPWNDCGECGTPCSQACAGCGMTKE